jgi:hypothetical protein
VVDENDRLRKEVARLRSEMLNKSSGDILDQAVDVAGVRFLAVEFPTDDAKALREAADKLRDRMKSGVGILAARAADKVLLLAFVTDDLVASRGLRADVLVRETAKVLGGGGGGRPQLATAGGKDPERISRRSRGAGRVERMFPEPPRVASPASPRLRYTRTSFPSTPSPTGSHPFHAASPKVGALRVSLRTSCLLTVHADFSSPWPFSRLPVLSHAAERPRSPRSKWIHRAFKSEADWTAAKEKLVADVPLISKFEGRLAESPQTLLDGLGTYMRLGQSFERVYTYASQHFDEDTRVGRSQEMEQEADDVGQKLRTAASFVRPEIIALGKEKMEQYLAAEPRLADSRPYLENLVRWAPHTLNADEEKIVAQAGRLAGAPGDIRGVFVNAEIPYPSVTLSEARACGSTRRPTRSTAPPETEIVAFQAAAAHQTSDGRSARPLRSDEEPHLHAQRAKVRHMPRGRAL